MYEFIFVHTLLSKFISTWSDPNENLNLQNLLQCWYLLVLYTYVYS